MHMALGQVYVTGPRFTASYDTHCGGSARWFAAAIEADAARGGGHRS
jgi:hypothetical protein